MNKPRISLYGAHYILETELPSVNGKGDITYRKYHQKAPDIMIIEAEDLFEARVKFINSNIKALLAFKHALGITGCKWTLMIKIFPFNIHEPIQHYPLFVYDGQEITDHYYL
jgi:RAB protein geranylgeranyltransferase component A